MQQTAWPDFSSYGMQLQVAARNGRRTLIMRSVGDNVAAVQSLGFAPLNDTDWYSDNYTREDGTLRSFDTKQWLGAFPSMTVRQTPLSDIIAGKPPVANTAQVSAAVTPKGTKAPPTRIWHDKVLAFASKHAKMPSELFAVVREHPETAMPVRIGIGAMGSPVSMAFYRLDTATNAWRWAYRVDLRPYVGAIERIATPERTLSGAEFRRVQAFLVPKLAQLELQNEPFTLFYAEHGDSLPRAAARIDLSQAEQLGLNIKGEAVIEAGGVRAVLRDGQVIAGEDPHEEPWRFLRGGTVADPSWRDVLNCAAGILRSNAGPLTSTLIADSARVVFGSELEGKELDAATGYITDAFEAVLAFGFNREMTTLDSAEARWEAAKQARAGQTPAGTKALPLPVAAIMSNALGNHYYSLVDCNALSPVFLAFAPKSAMATLLVPESDEAEMEGRRAWFASITRDIANRFELQPRDHGAPLQSERMIGTFTSQGAQVFPVLHEELRVTRSDHYEVAKLVTSLHEAGRAAFLIDGDEVPGTISAGSAPFFNWLNDHYTVSIADLDERLFAPEGGEGGERHKRLVVIEGARPQAVRRDAPATVPLMTSYDEAYRFTAAVDARCKVADDERAALRQQQTEAEAEKLRTEEDLQRDYKPLAEGPATLRIPRNLAGPTEDALAEIKERIAAPGQSLNAAVAAKLGYSERLLNDVLQPEQIDAVALCIDALARNRAPIIADNTGTGKGRILASMVRYAHVTGKPVVFLTEREDLISTFWADICDIKAEDDVVPYVLGNGHKLRAQTGALLDKGNKQRNNEVADAMDQGGWPKSERGDRVSLFIGAASVASLEGPHQRVLESAIDRGALLILDEAHNFAGNESKAGEFVSSLIERADSVVQSSATFLRSENNLSLYRRALPMKVGVDTLQMAVRTGGIALQESIAVMLARDGVLLRRERPTGDRQIGIFTDSREERNREFGNLYADFMNQIARATEKASGVIGRWLAYSGLSKNHAAKDQKINVADPGLWSSAQHLTNQFLIALKADALVDAAMQAIEDGQKPIIAIGSTMQKVLDREIQVAIQGKLDASGFAEDSDEYETLKKQLQRSHPPLPEIPTFDKALNLALEKVLTVRLATLDQKVQKKGGKRPTPVITKIMLTDVYNTLDAADQKTVDGIKRDLSQLAQLASKFRVLPGDPISYILDEIEHRGSGAQRVAVAEMTGRQHRLVRVDGGYVRAGNNRDKNAVRDAFNGGRIDVLVVNQAISAGISLHADARVADQRVRNFINGQYLTDIVKQVQLFGRVDRNNQVVPPVYTSVSSGLPVEQRLMALYNVQLRRVSASSTANRQSVLAADTVDIMNEVGDEVCRRYLVNQPMMAKFLGFKVNVEADKKPYVSSIHNTTAISSLSNVLTSRLIMMDVDSQERVYSELAREYVGYLRELDVAGANPLKTNALPGQVAEMSARLMHGSGSRQSGDSAFDAPLYLREIRYREPVESFDSDDVMDKVKAARHRMVNSLKASKAGGSLADLVKLMHAHQGTILQDLRESLAGQPSEQVAAMLESRERELLRLREVIRDISPGAVIRYTDGGQIVRGVVCNVRMPLDSYGSLFGGDWRSAEPKAEQEEKVVRRCVRESQWVLQIATAEYGWREYPLNILLNDSEFAVEGVPFNKAHPLARAFSAGITTTQPRTTHVLEGNAMQAAILAARFEAGLEPVQYTTVDGVSRFGLELKNAPAAKIRAIENAPVRAARYDLARRFIESHKKTSLATEDDPRSGTALTLRQRGPVWQLTAPNTAKARAAWNIRSSLKKLVGELKPMKDVKTRIGVELDNAELDAVLAQLWLEDTRFFLPASKQAWIAEVLNDPSMAVPDPVDVLYQHAQHASSAAP